MARSATISSKPFDLADPDRPKEAWRRSIPAFKVVLAPNGLGYAALLPSGKAGTPGRIPARIDVHWVDGLHDGKTIEDDEAGLAIPAFSSRGSMLLLNVGGYLKVFDLRLDKPIAIQQTRYSEVDQYICPQVLESGNVVVRSAQWPRLEILALRPELPRVAAVPFERDPASENACADVMGSAENAIYLKGWNDSIAEVDLIRAEAPTVSRVWSMRANVWPAGVDGANHLFAYGGNRLNQFVIYDLNDSIAAHVDWAALADAHEHALHIYDESKNPLRGQDARNILEQANVQRALDAPVEGIAPRKAAAILNDYGFLIAKPWISRTDAWSDREPPPAEPYLRRSIELDRGRAIAYLNLADLLRNGLGDTIEWEKKSAKIAEVEQLYRRYLVLGGAANASIDAFLQGDLGKSNPEDICGAIAAYANAGRLNELVSFRPLGAAVGSRKVDIVFSEQGTSHSPTASAFDASTGEPVSEFVEIPADEEHLWGGDQLALVTYHDITQIIHLKDMRHPVSTFLPSGKRACAFRPAVQEQIGRRPLEPALCRQLAQGKGPESLEFSKPASMSREETQSRYGETEARSLRSFDALNDGKPINVVHLELSSGAGPGCDETFYDAVDETGEHFLTTSVHDRLMALQLADPSNRYPTLPCSNAPRFFQYKSKNYFETKPLSWPPDSSFNEYHRVRRAERDKAVDVCDFTFRTRITSVPLNAPKR